MVKIRVFHEGEILERHSKLLKGIKLQMPIQGQNRGTWEAI